MKVQLSQPNYGPKEWDFDFSFDLDLSFSDYLFIGLYLVFIVPFALLLELVQFIYFAVKDTVFVPSERQEKPGKTHGLLSMISKYF